jgi:chitodextrinase
MSCWSSWNRNIRGFWTGTLGRLISTIGIVLASVAPANAAHEPLASLTLQAQSDWVRLVWDASATPGVEYLVGSRTAVGTEKLEPAGTALTFTVTGLTPGQTYFFRVYASNNDGRSLPSNEVSTALTAPPDTTAPTAPASLTGTAASQSQINLSWPACTDNVAVTAYEILRNQLPRATVPATQTTYSDVGLPPATTFTYAVRCKDAAGNLSTESPNAIVTTLGDTTAPSIPGNLVATVTQTSACLTWTAATDNLSVQGYRITREGALPALTSGLNFCENGLTPNTAYLYSLTAFDHAANHSIPATVTATTQALPAPCVNNGKPYAITIQVLSWTSPVPRGGEGEIRYRLLNAFPITRIEALLGTQVSDEIAGTELRGVRSQVVRVPNTAGTYNLFLRARDSAGCVTTTTTIRPLVVQ